MELPAAYAFGVEFRLLATDEGGRSGPLLDDGSTPWRYRPTWGLPGMVAPEQAGGPVFGLSRPAVEPGESCRAIVVAMFPEITTSWTWLEAGDELPMYEGVQVVGLATVLAPTRCTLPLTDADAARFTAWLADASVGL